MHRKQWTNAETARLRELWQEVQPRELKRQFPDRTWCALRARARTLGLPFGVPQGYVSLTRAARAAGYSRDGLVTILRHMQVATFKEYPYRGCTRRRVSPMRYVDPDAVREAVERWTTLENVSDAARRYGVHPNVMTRMLRAAGVLDRAVLGGAGYRLDPRVTDGAMCRRSVGERVTSAASRIGVSYAVLARALRARGQRISRSRRDRLLLGEAEHALCLWLALWCPMDVLTAVVAALDAGVAENDCRPGAARGRRY